MLIPFVSVWTGGAIHQNCYNPPANYKVLANRSGFLVGQWVGLGEEVSPLANGLTCWPMG